MFLIQLGVSTYVLQVVETLADDIVVALPRLLAGLIFLAVAAVLVQLVVLAVRAALRRSLSEASPVYRRFVTTVVALFLWFGVALSFLTIVGLRGIATALGTASGFVALGVAYALSGMIADSVAGVYLLRDPDFSPDDEVIVGDMTGVVRSIELRKTRFDGGGDTVVRANAESEKPWTKRS